MTDTAWERQREVRDALQTIVSDPQLGIAALSSPQTMSNLLKDLLPDAPRETSVLVAAAEAGLAQILLDHVCQGMDAATAASLAASAFAARTPFTPEACDWAVAELSVALGIGPNDRAETLPAPGAAHIAGPVPAAGPGYGQPAPRPTVGPAVAGPGYGQPAAGPTVGPIVAERGYAPGYGPPAGPGYGAPASPGRGAPVKQKSTKAWGIVTAAIIGIAVLGGIIALVTHTGTITTVEPLSQLVGPDVASCQNAATLGMRGVSHAQSCHTHAKGIGLVGYQFSTAAGYADGLAELNLLTGFGAGAPGHGCPPPSGSTSGRSPWHSNDNGDVGPRAGQILECYPYSRDSRIPIYLWTLPTQRVILIANDQAPGATYTSLGNWWSGLSYG